MEIEKKTFSFLSKREKIIVLSAFILIALLTVAVIYEYTVIAKTQKQIKSMVDTSSSVSDDGKVVWVTPEAEPVENNSNLGVTVESSSDIIAESVNSEDEKEENTDFSPEAVKDYVLNTNSKKIHSPDCDSAKKTKDKNKSCVSWNEEEYQTALNDGYTPCSICNAGR